MLGPPKTLFNSATPRGSRNIDSAERPALRDTENSRDRHSFRGKNGEVDSERTREGRSNLLRPKRAEGDADSDGWSTVKPRKSFGTEGAERFNGRMGVGRDRERDEKRDDRRFKDREDRDRDVKDRPSRGFDTFAKVKDEHEQDRDARRNGLGRGRGESWRAGDDGPPTPRDRNSNGDKYADRSRGWREKERDERGERGNDRNERNERTERGDRGDRRWGRDQRHEVEPEWLEAAEDKKGQAHTQEDFEKWRQSTRRGEEKSRASETIENEEPPSPPRDCSEDPGLSLIGRSAYGLKLGQPVPLADDRGPDKFFGKWATPEDENAPASGPSSKKEGAIKFPSGGKASRFTSFFSPQEEAPRRPEPPLPVPSVPANDFFGGLLQNSSRNGDHSNNKSTSQDQEAFALILQKLQNQSKGGDNKTPPANIQQQPKPPSPRKQQGAPLPPLEPFAQYRVISKPEATERLWPNEGSNVMQDKETRSSQQPLEDLLNARSAASSRPTLSPIRPSEIREDSPLKPHGTSRLNLQPASREEMLTERYVASTQPTVSRPEQMLQELVGQRQNALSQGSIRSDQPQSRNNTEFLMNLMRAAPEPQRTEQVLLRMPPQRSTTADRQAQQQQQMMEREQEMHRELALRERNAAQHQARSQLPNTMQVSPGGFYSYNDDPSMDFQRAPPPRHASNAPQPTQILQRPPPGIPLSWENPAHPQQPRQHNIAPPPGLGGGPSRMPMPMQQQMFPPSFPQMPQMPQMGNFPPHDGLNGPPRMQPPPGFFNAPPPNFMPPGFQAGPPDGMGPPFGPPFDGRGPPPQGPFRR